MKISNVVFASLMLVSAGVWTGCDEIEDLNLTNVSAPVESEFRIASSDSLAERSEFVDASTNSDYINNRSKIENIEIDRLEYQVKSIEAGTADSIIEGRIEYLNPANGNQPELLTTLNNKKFNVNVAQDLAFEPAVAEKLITIFKSNDPKVTLRVKARVNKKPVNVLLALKFYLKLKIKI